MIDRGIAETLPMRKEGKNGKNIEEFFWMLCLSVFSSPFSSIFTVCFFATLKPSSETKAAGPWRHVGVTKALSCDCPSALLCRKFCGPQEFSAYPDVGQAAVTYTDPWAAYEDSTCDLPMFLGGRIFNDFGQGLNQGVVASQC